MADYNGSDRAGLAAAVTGLLNARCPSDITRFVVAMRIDSVKGIEGLRFRPRPNVIEESLKATRTFPLRTNGDTASPVVGELSVVAVEAALIHCGPRGVFRRPLTVAGVPVSARPACRATPEGACVVASKTSTGITATASQRITSGSYQLSAVAPAVPSRFAADVDSGTAHDSKTAEAMAYQVDDVHSQTLAQRIRMWPIF